jgi:hypothetical protein
MSKTFARRADAEAWARQQEAEMDRGAWRDRSSADSTTLYALLERYLKDVVPTKRGAEVEALRIKTLMRDEITRHKLSALSPAGACRMAGSAARRRLQGRHGAA